MLGVSPTQAGYTIHDGFCDGCGELESVAWPHPSFAAPPELPLFFPPDVPASAITGNVPTMTTTGTNPHLSHGSAGNAPAPLSAPMAAPAPTVDAVSTATAAAPAPATAMAPVDAAALGPVVDAAPSNGAPAAKAPAAVPAQTADNVDASVTTASLP